MSESTMNDAMLGTMFATIGIVWLLLIVFAIFCLVVEYKVVKELGYEHPILVIIPILNIYVLCEVATENMEYIEIGSLKIPSKYFWLYILLGFIPVVGSILIIVCTVLMYKWLFERLDGPNSNGTVKGVLSTFLTIVLPFLLLSSLKKYKENYGYAEYSGVTENVTENTFDGSNSEGD